MLIVICVFHLLLWALYIYICLCLSLSLCVCVCVCVCVWLWLGCGINLFWLSWRTCWDLQLENLNSFFRVSEQYVRQKNYSKNYSPESSDIGVKTRSNTWSIIHNGLLLCLTTGSKSYIIRSKFSNPFSFLLSNK